MSEIPLEVMMHAERLYDEGGYESVPTLIAKAILVERERCADIVYIAALDDERPIRAWRDIVDGFNTSKPRES